MRMLLLGAVLALVRPPAAPAAAIAVKTFTFAPRELVVPIGTTVTWTNADEIEHTVTAGAPEAPAPVFDGTLAGKGAIWRRTFTKPGTYAYHCARHQFMRGTVRVTPTGEP